MPFAVKDVLQHKRNERQIREIHEREYEKYISNLRQQTFKSNMSYLSAEHIREVERSRLRFIFDKQNQYERIKRENELLSQRFFQPNKQTLIDNKNLNYEENLKIFYLKRSQQRSNEHKRIKNENRILVQRIHNAQGQLIKKKQCEQDWQQHIKFMKKTCNYPENIDQFVSNKIQDQHQQMCRFHSAKRSSHFTKNPLNILLDLSE